MASLFQKPFEYDSKIPAKDCKGAFLGITLNTIKNINQSPFSDERLAMDLFEQSYKDEFTLYTKENIKNCTALLVKRAKEVT